MIHKNIIKVLGCGALNLDIIFEVQDLEKIREHGWPLYPGREIAGTHEEAERLIALLKEKGRLLAKSGGGSAANTISALSALGHECYFLGTVGNDSQGEEVLNSMEGIDTSFIEKEGRTATCIVVLEKKSRDRAMFVAPASFLPEKCLEKALEAISMFDLLHFSSLVREDGVAFQTRLAEKQAPNQLVSLDPGELYASKGLPQLRPLLAETSLLMITSVEVELLTGLALKTGIPLILAQMLKKMADAALFNALNEAGGALLVCKKGSEGACALGLNNIKKCQPAEKIEKIIDNTGAGDAFAAGFIDGMAQGKELQACLESAISLAAISLTDFGRKYLSSLKCGK